MMNRKLRFAAATLSALLAVTWMTPLALSEEGDAPPTPTQGKQTEAAASSVSVPEPAHSGGEGQSSSGSNSAAPAQTLAKEEAAAPVQDSAESKTPAPAQDPTESKADAPGQADSPDSPGNSKDNPDAPDPEPMVSPDAPSASEEESPREEDTNRETAAPDPMESPEPTEASTPPPDDLAPEATEEPSEPPATDEESTPEPSPTDIPEISSPAASLAEDAAFTSGYALVLPGSVPVYSHWQDREERTQLLKLHQGEVVWVDGLEEHTQDEKITLWASVSVLDGNKEPVSGFVKAETLRGLEAEAASVHSGTPTVSGKRIQPEGERGTKPAQEDLTPEGLPPDDLAPDPAKQPSLPQDILAGASIRTAMAFEGDVLTQGAQVTLTAEVDGLPEGVAYTLHWQNDLHGDYQDVPGGAAASLTVTATPENMVCNWRVRLLAVAQAPEEQAQENPGEDQ